MPGPAARRQFATGGTFAPATAAFLDEVGNERIEKPFTAKPVRKIVQRFLR